MAKFLTCFICISIQFLNFNYGEASLPRLPVAVGRRLHFHGDPTDADRIVGGIPAELGELPYQVSLQVKSILSGNFHHFCGGAFVTPLCVVTAAHCAQGRQANELFVIAGAISLNDTNRTVFNVSKIKVNPLYNTESVYNDIAVIKLSQPATFGDSIKPIGLPSAKQETDAKTPLTVSGWGTTKEYGSLSNRLLYTEVPAISDQECRKAYGDKEIAESMICAGFVEQGGKDSCQGDSGGPLVTGFRYKAKLVGIVSWGFGCARPKYPGVYTQVSYFLDFLKAEDCIPSHSKPPLNLTNVN